MTTRSWSAESVGFGETGTGPAAPPSIRTTRGHRCRGALFRRHAFLSFHALRLWAASIRSIIAPTMPPVSSNRMDRAISDNCGSLINPGSPDWKVEPKRNKASQHRKQGVQGLCTP
jgi:hypothetical protein